MSARPTAAHRTPRAARPLRVRRSGEASFEISFKDLRIDLRAHRVWRAGQEVALTPREYALLETLWRHRDTALTRGELLADAWGYAYIGASRTVDVHINRLRRKLGLAREIQTVFKVGYRLSAAG